MARVSAACKTIERARLEHPLSNQLAEKDHEIIQLRHLCVHVHRCLRHGRNGIG
jgi:hypothetical protein